MKATVCQRKQQPSQIGRRYLSLQSRTRTVKYRIPSSVPCSQKSLKNSSTMRLNWMFMAIFLSPPLSLAEKSSNNYLIIIKSISPKVERFHLFCHLLKISYNSLFLWFVLCPIKLNIRFINRLTVT